MRDLADLKTYWARHSGEQLALCTLVRKTGSSYRKPGAKKIVARAGGSCGLLSGGCLEPDIEAAARDNWAQMPFVRSFSTLSPEDKILGYQTGCAGVIEVLFEQLPVFDERADLYLPFGADARADGVAIDLGAKNPGQRRFGAANESGDNVFFDVWRKPVALFVAGCGIDAAPFAGLAAMLGWGVTFIDYRASLRGNLPADANVIIAPLPEIAALIGNGPQAALVVMTHNFNADLAVLQGLAARGDDLPGYIGCLGPRARFEEMMAAADAALPQALTDAVQVPAGLFTNSHEPMAIALSIVAQIQARLE